MNFILTDTETRKNLLPLTFTRPIADIRIGITTIREKWERFLGQKVSILTEDYLAEKFPAQFSSSEDNIVINASFLPSASLSESIKQATPGTCLEHKEKFIAINIGKDRIDSFRLLDDYVKKGKKLAYNSEFIEINNLWDIFLKNDYCINVDFQLILHEKKSKELSLSNKIIGKEDLIFIEEGASVEAAVLNTTTGPIYIGRNAEVMEGSLIRGPFALCEHSSLKMGAKIYGATTIGPHSKVGGEINNSVIFGYSNKAHDGFLGNSVIGEWCNLGADTNNSNLKNNYSDVKIWNYSHEKYKSSGLQFCGLLMGDHSKCGINSMFNTGTVVGVFANVFGGGFPPKFIPSFSWGGADGFTEYKLEKAFEVADAVMTRRGIQLSDADKKILSHIFSYTGKYRDLAFGNLIAE
jgi:UDP-N-acetylglucosamine diphosphorylase/glucosamine-1-phosphate N-acetyltransferase